MQDKKNRSRGLGRGLSALMADVTTAAEAEAAPDKGRRVDMVPIERLSANPDQPRRTFDAGDLDDLTASIREKGVLQPLIVRRSGDSGYEIVAGERRWRAAQQAQVHELPVLIRDLSDVEVLEIAIIENIQRADLNAIEEAAGYRRLMDEFGHTQEQMAAALGKSRSHIANLLRLLSLPADVQDLLRDGKLSAGHARALVTAENPSELARAVVKGGLSVRATEALVKRKLPGPRPTPKPASEKDADTAALEGDLSANLGMKVELKHKPGQETGELSIRYRSLDDLDTLCRLLNAI
ncbi:ParB/RepB/Spo0J family partition protein [Pukyongiella litopenaei]|uniref:ParB/RepB/Spo0J family partition protein n=1 Tax=Pukyongiella litopenaei TaxID=2605946 RepID=A0A2S0MPS9_9RHOB|nr:ParB/RepB/Spo0J family partition protein [Pukyongiella litopenaei]AVO37847.1 ParB/RepB/Spo0J family partition protein [Pukyongiella litopenaei]